MLLGKRGRGDELGEVEEVAVLVSAGTGRRYALTMVCGICTYEKGGLIKPPTCPTNRDGYNQRL